MSDKQSSFIPNSFQTPNSYVDNYLHLFTPEEWLVMTYAIRRILGFNKRSDRISLSQFANGITDRNGNHLDYGCGLSVNTIRDVLKSLCGFGFLIRLSENDPTVNTGPEYSLQLDDSKIRLSAMLARAGNKKKESKARTKQAIRVMKSVRKQYPLMSDSTTPKKYPLMSDDTPPLMSDSSTPPHVAQQHNIQGNTGNTEIYNADAISGMSVSQVKKLPEMKLFEKVTNSFPGVYQWAKIILFIRDKQPSEEKMRECWEYWSGVKGYRPNDITWLLEWTINGIPNGKSKPNGKKTNTPPDEESDTFMQDREAAQKEFEKEQ